MWNTADVSNSWAPEDGLDLGPQLIYTLSWESQRQEIESPNVQMIIIIFCQLPKNNQQTVCVYLFDTKWMQRTSKQS